MMFFLKKIFGGKKGNKGYHYGRSGGQWALKYCYIKANGYTVHDCLIQQRKLIVTAHPHRRPLSYCRECILHINANNPCLHLKSNASQQRRGISMVVFYLDIGWSPMLITKNKDGFQVKKIKISLVLWLI